MSQLRLGTNPDGTRHVVVLEPATARRAGFGGSALGYFQGIVLTHAQRKATEDAVKRHPKDGAGARKL